MCGSKLKKTIKKIDPLMGGDRILDAVGLPSVLGEENGIFNTPEMATGSVMAAPTAPTEQDASVQQSRADERRRRAMSGGSGGTILTGPSGLGGAATTSSKTLLGA